MDKALEIFQKLSSINAIPVTQESIENLTGVKLSPPNTDYPPSVQKMLIERGLDPHLKPRYLQGSMEINDEILLKIHFANPLVELSFMGQTKQIPPPDPLTNESLRTYTNSLAADHDAAIKQNCILRNSIFALFERNDWTLINHPLSADIPSEDGNFYFARLQDSSTVTMNDGCLVSLDFTKASNNPAGGPRRQSP